MNRISCAAISLALLLAPVLARSQPPGVKSRKPAAAKQSGAAARPVKAPAKKGQDASSKSLQGGTEGVSLEEARRSVEMLNEVYQLTLQEVHRRFPVDSGQPVVAALVIRDIQKRMNTRVGPQSRFLAVDLRAMNPDHAPKDAFEREAAAKLAAGARRHEVVEGGRLRMATVVPLGGTCFPCHSTPAGGIGRAAISWSVALAE